MAALAPTQIYTYSQDGRYFFSGGRKFRLCDNGRHIEVPLSAPPAVAPQRPTSLAAWLRSPPVAGASIVLGFASVWQNIYFASDGLETVNEGAFAGALRQGADVAALIGHDPLSRVASFDAGNLFLAEDDVGLFVAAAVRPGHDCGLVDDIRLSTLCAMSIGYCLARDDREPRPRRVGLSSPSVITGRSIDEVSFTSAGANPATCCLVARDERGKLIVPSQGRMPELRRRALDRLVELASLCAPTE